MGQSKTQVDPDNAKFPKHDWQFVDDPKQVAQLLSHDLQILSSEKVPVGHRIHWATNHFFFSIKSCTRKI